MISIRQPRDSIAPVIATNGAFMLFIGLSEWVVALLGTALGWEDVGAFWLSGLLVNLIGAIAFVGSYDDDIKQMSRRQVILAILSGWFVACIAAAPPFMLARSNFDFSFALFESVSALTTTGATVMVGIETMPKTILMWRSLLHWYGGMGIIIGALVFFPAMRVGGMQFFLRTGFEDSDKILPSARSLGIATFSAYGLLTFACFFCYNLAGMPSFDAVNMAMSTMATGGLAVSDSSFGIYEGSLEYIASLFMILAGFPLVVFILALRGRVSAIWRDGQVPVFLAIFAIMVFLISAYRLAQGQDGFENILRDSLFSSASMLTGTGFTNGDFQLWGAFPTMILLFAMFIGGCTGSTAGAVKIFRYQVLYELIRVRIKQLHFPHGVFQPRYQGHKLDDKVVASVAAFFMIYLTTLAILTMLFMFSGLDLITGFSAAVSAVGNVGPGLGSEIGPVGNYAGFGTAPLWIYLISMFVGRLEFMLFFLLFVPRFWRH